MVVGQQGNRASLVLRHLGVGRSTWLGGGGEADVYQVDDNRVVRVWLGTPHVDLNALAQLYETLGRAGLPFATPEWLEVGAVAGIPYAVERRYRGVPLLGLLPGLGVQNRRRALRSYLDAACVLGRDVDLAWPWFGELLAVEPVRSESWAEFLRARAAASVRLAGERLRADVPGLDDRFATWSAALDGLPPLTRGRLVHGDFFPGNVILGSDLSVSAVVDFGLTAVSGDPLLDIAGALGYLAVREHRADDVTFLNDVVAQRFGDLRAPISLYRTYTNLYFSFTAELSPKLYRWCVAGLTAAPNIY